jgi:hypothetical protein
MKRTNVAVFATSAQSDALTVEEQPRPLIPGGRWVFDLLVPALASASFHVAAVMPTSSGYWVLPVRGGGRTFDLIVSDISPVFVCEIMEPRSFADWLLRRSRDPQFERAFKAVCDVLRADSRVRDLLAFSGTKKEGDTFVGEAIERLERALGIYSR